MQPAAKKKRLTQEPTGGTVPGSFARATIKCKKTPAYASAYKAMTLVSAKQANRRIGTANWYRLKKDALVATIVLNHFAQEIQRFFRRVVVVTTHDGDDDTNTAVCPISLKPIAEIPCGHRFRHGNIWFNKEILAQYMRKTSDFINPVTRVELREEDVLRIDPGLINQYKHRREHVARMAEDMAVVQSVENELEEVFQEMVEAAQEIPTRMEFRIVFDNLAEDFQQCHGDLTELDRDRSALTMKSLGDLVDGDPTRRVHMSKKRERILRHFLKTQK
ncbi:unnamed protein product [Ectocarpus sp. 4 AP-2014]|uniref:EsV-1-140 n=1 Tax=Ectocarpus siliculosus virus 1 (isolate New Zealand/Kaikoura/1988) TaxID=654926 RepID=Q8QND9_ESV1K|nr:EsV-1-140 [Ectocarpus siliculosus virus 1]AAK14558.1 EsV-1-140 [Ectocarpus siliculosus virus 1]